MADSPPLLFSNLLQFSSITMAMNSCEVTVGLFLVAPRYAVVNWSQDSGKDVINNIRKSSSDTWLPMMSLDFRGNSNTNSERDWIINVVARQSR